MRTSGGEGSIIVVHDIRTNNRVRICAGAAVAEPHEALICKNADSTR
jgi:hypothetical protein